MNQQEIFNTVVTALRKQGAKSYDVRGNPGAIFCLYRGPNNVKCAVGHLIPDDQYLPEMEGATFDEMISFLKEPFQSIFLQNKQFLIELQNIHDCCDPGSWEQEWENFAKEKNLTLPPKN